MARVIIGYSCCPLTAQAFAAHGHDVWTCDLLPSRGWHQHMQCDVWDAIQACGPWDFGVFHPMCTYLTVSAAWAYNDPDYGKYPGVGYHQKVKPGTLVGAERRAAQAEELENFRRLRALPFPAGIENPARSYVCTAIRKPDQCIQPYEFGDDASKLTGLWLSEGVPLLRGTQYVAPRMVCKCGHTWRYGAQKKTTHGYFPQYECPRCDGIHKSHPRWSNQTDSGQNRLSPSETRWLERSATYPGIAAAMGDQWGEWLTRTSYPRNLSTSVIQ